MAYKIKREDVWAVDVRNTPGMLARVLEGLTLAGAQLEFIVGRRVTAKTSRIFVSPLKGRKQLAAAADVGLNPAPGMHAVRIEGPDRAGLGSELARDLAAAGLNLRGFSGATIGKNSVIYLGLQTAGDAATAIAVARRTLSAKRKPAGKRAPAPSLKPAAKRKSAAKKLKAAPKRKTIKRKRR